MFSEKIEIVLKNRFETWERQSLTSLYLPILGSDANALYLTLLSFGELLYRDNSLKISKNLIEMTTGLTESQLVSAKRKLEAMKLIESYSNSDDNFMVCFLYSPLEPSDFFNHKLFNNILISRIGADDYELVRYMFRENDKNVENKSFENTTTHFSEVFGSEADLPDFTDISSFKVKSKSDFCFINENQLMDICKRLKLKDINIDINNKKSVNLIFEVKEAFNLSLDEITLCISRSYNVEDIDLSRKAMIREAKFIVDKSDDLDVFSRITKEQRKIDEFEKYTSDRYLKGLMKVDRLSSSLIGTIKELRSNYKLHDSVINTLFDFSYYKNDKKIVQNYILKIAKSFAEKQIKTSIEAMDYLKKAFVGSTATNAKSKKTTYDYKKTSYISEADWTDDDFKDLFDQQIDASDENMSEILRKLD